MVICFIHVPWPSTSSIVYKMNKCRLLCGFDIFAVYRERKDHIAQFLPSTKRERENVQEACYY